jgi:hypothetical protein
VVLVAALLLAGCGGTPSAAPGPAASGPVTSSAATSSAGTSPSAASSSAASSTAGPGLTPKVLVLVEENEPASNVIGSSSAPYLNALARSYGTATSVDAGYPASCPSLPAYLILTSGSDHDICDDDDPAQHPLPGPSIFSQLADAGRQWRTYAESMPANCSPANSDDGRYLVRHTASPYYLTERGRCGRWAVPLGTVKAGALHDAVVTGTLPDYSLVTPNACNDMHGADGCPADLIRAGDRWLAGWMPAVLAGPDFRSGRLVVIVTWDEGSDEDNHIPTLVIHRNSLKRSVGTPFTLCSVLRTSEELLALPLLGCAADAASMVTPFGLPTSG